MDIHIKSNPDTCYRRLREALWCGWSDRQAVGCTGMMMRPNRDFERRWDFRSRKKSENIPGKRCV